MAVMLAMAGTIHAGPAARNPSSGFKTAGIVAVGGIFRAVPPQWHTAIGNFLNSPSYNATDLRQEIRALAQPATQAAVGVQAAQVQQQGFANRRRLVEAKAPEFIRRLDNPTPEEALVVTQKLAELNAIVAPYISEQERERQVQLKGKMGRIAEALAGQSKPDMENGGAEVAASAGASSWWKLWPKAWRLRRLEPGTQRREMAEKVPAPTSAVPIKAAAIQVTGNMRSAWSRVMSEVESSASRSRDRSAVSGAHFALKAGIDRTIDEFTDASQTATREEAMRMSGSLDWLIGSQKLTTEQGARIRNLKAALDDYDSHRSRPVLIDPVTVKDSPFEALGLAESNVALQANVSETFASSMDQALGRLAKAEQISMLRSLARTAGWGNDFVIPSTLQQKLMANNEWSEFAGNVSAYALDELARIGTADALAEVALQMTMSVRISDEQYFVLSNKADHILRTADPLVVRQAVAIAQQALKYPPYDSGSGHTRILAAKLSELQKSY